MSLFVWWRGSVLTYCICAVFGAELRSLGVISCEVIIQYQTQFWVCWMPTRPLPLLPIFRHKWLWDPSSLLILPFPTLQTFIYEYMWKNVEVVWFCDLFLQQEVTKFNAMNTVQPRVSSSYFLKVRAVHISRNTLKSMQGHIKCPFSRKLCSIYPSWNFTPVHYWVMQPSITTWGSAYGSSWVVHIVIQITDGGTI